MNTLLIITITLVLTLSCVFICILSTNKDEVWEKIRGDD